VTASSEERDPRSRLLLITYHYIRDDVLPYPGIHPITIAELRNQIVGLMGRFHMASVSEAEEFVLGQGELPGPSALLTFDDGLREHLDVARHVLEPLGLQGLFFVCSRPLQETRALVVHKIHWLRATMPPDAFLEAIATRIPRALMEMDPAAEEAAQLAYPYDTPENAKLKYLMNFVLAPDLIDNALSNILQDLGIDEPEFCRRTYMSEADLRSLHEAGHAVAGHSHSHAPLARLSKADLAADLGRNVDFLQALLGMRPRWLSYPYGSPSAVPASMSSLSRDLGISFAVTLFRGWVTKGQDPLKLKRINTNEVASFAA
jgi:peptidoglycan/xylan/chitin deacetylase (PgdA/CDA1 family)